MGGVVRSRLFPALALSLLLHLALAIAVRSPPAPRAAPVVVLAARLSPAAPVVRADPPPAQGESKRASRQSAARRLPSETAAEPVNRVAVTPPSPLSRDAILAAAREIARSEPQIDGLGTPRQAAAIADRALLPGLAKALENKGAGTRVSRYSNGMIKVESAAGSTYCLLPPPAIPQDGVPQVSIAVTCP